MGDTPLKDPENTINRLLDEVRNYREKLAEIRLVVSNIALDFERLSIIGGINKVVTENIKLKAEVKALDKELLRKTKSW